MSRMSGKHSNDVPKIRNEMPKVVMELSQREGFDLTTLRSVEKKFVSTEGVTPAKCR